MLHHISPTQTKLTLNCNGHAFCPELTKVALVCNAQQLFFAPHMQVDRMHKKGLIIRQKHRDSCSLAEQW